MNNFFNWREHAGSQAEKFYKTTIWQGEHVLVGMNCLEPGQTQKVHAHDGADKFYFVLEGDGQIHRRRRRKGCGRRVARGCAFRNLTRRHEQLQRKALAAGCDCSAIQMSSTKHARPAATSLELSETELRELSSRMTQIVTDYFSAVSTLPVFPETAGGKTMRRARSIAANRS